MNRRLKVLAPIFVLLAGIVGVWLAMGLRPQVELEPPARQPPLVRVQRVRVEPVQFVVRAHGTVAPRSESGLIPQVSGEVVWVAPSLVAGGFFEEGEALLRIDPADNEVALESARASVARGRSEYERSGKELERQKRLARSSVASDAAYDDAVNAERVARASLRESEARLTQAERDLARTEISAPYAGRVREEAVDVGQFVTRGSEVARIYAVDFAEVRLPIPDAELRYLDLTTLVRAEVGGEAGPQVRLSAEFAGQRHAWQGRIVRTEGEIDARTRMVHVVARVDDP
jgi:RND family efflux transporter MFP subunit